MDNLKIRAPRDSDRINIHEEYEIRYWTRALNVSEERLIATVKKVGFMAGAVRKELAA